MEVAKLLHSRIESGNKKKYSMPRPAELTRIWTSKLMGMPTPLLPFSGNHRLLFVMNESDVGDRWISFASKF